MSIKHESQNVARDVAIKAVIVSIDPQISLKLPLVNQAISAYLDLPTAGIYTTSCYPNGSPLIDSTLQPNVTTLFFPPPSVYYWQTPALPAAPLYILDANYSPLDTVLDYLQQHEGRVFFIHTPHKNDAPLYRQLVNVCGVSTANPYSLYDSLVPLWFDCLALAMEIDQFALDRLSLQIEQDNHQRQQERAKKYVQRSKERMFGRGRDNDKT